MTTTPTNEAGHGLPERALAAWTGKHRADAENRAFLAGYETCQSDMNAAALALSRGVPADMVLVPREPTEAMIEAICDRHAGKSVWPDDYGDSAQAIRRRQARDGYRAVLQAAPAAAGAQGEEYAACCDTPTYCSSVRRCTRMDTTPRPAAAKYEEANPLGGPATMLEAAARRVRAGEDFHEVLADYALLARQEGEDARDAARYRWLAEKIEAMDGDDTMEVLSRFGMTYSWWPGFTELVDAARAGGGG